MKIRRLPEDDYMHEPESASNFNESRYYNFFDHTAGMGGWVRMGNRVNEGYAELTVCLYLPDGSVAFNYKRPKIEHNKEHNAGGLRFEVLKPYEEHRVTYEGKVCVLANPREMVEPRDAFTNNPFVECTIDLHMTNVGPGQGGEPEWEEGEAKPDLDPEKMFARGHTEQHMRSVGTITVGDQTFDLTDALGMRDHSWGPRYWQNVYWYRWITCNLGPDLGFGLTISGDEAGQRRVHGFLYDKKRYGDDRWVPVRNAELTSDYDADWFPLKNQITVTTDDHAYVVDGDVWSNIPLRNRRDDMVTRITEGMTRWSHDGILGAGLSEYLDQIIDETPVGTRFGI